ncbi:hypothetical protein C5167_047909 [Papaver somniferum]|uniref:Uncharacterized protein n=1 Tax=Papaver somniferum TaxID=3469 RepID=A0A4Y7KJ63_PAPSO|nr:hypothetical protein C5167_047909 [Papaver somniferum]
MVRRMRVEMVAAVRRTLALILMNKNDYVGAWKKLIDARTLFPGLEYIDEMIKVCDVICAAKSQGKGIKPFHYVPKLIDVTEADSITDERYKQIFCITRITNNTASIYGREIAIAGRFLDKQQDFDWSKTQFFIVIGKRSHRVLCLGKWVFSTTAMFLVPGTQNELWVKAKWILLGVVAVWLTLGAARALNGKMHRNGSWSMKRCMLYCAYGILMFEADGVNFKAMRILCVHFPNYKFQGFTS